MSDSPFIHKPWLFACLCRRGSRLAPAASAGQPTVCVRHTARHTLWDVQLVRQGWERGGGREGSPHATRRGRRSLPPPHPRVRRAEGVSGAPWSQEMRVAAQPQVSRAGVLPANEPEFPKPSRWSCPGSRGGHASRRGPRIRREGGAPVQSHARQDENKRTRASEGEVVKGAGNRRGCKSRNAEG